MFTTSLALPDEAHPKDGGRFRQAESLARRRNSRATRERNRIAEERNSENAKVKKKKRIPPRAYFDVRKLIDPQTGAEVGCLVPRHKADRMILREKGLKIGDVLRCEIRKPRNEKFNRLVHGLGAIVVQSVDGFQNFDSHGAIKRLQADSGVMCDRQVFQLPGFGDMVKVEPRSLAFDEMDEADFAIFWRGICAHLIEKYWPTLDDDAILHMVDLMPETPT